MNPIEKMAAEMALRWVVSNALGNIKWDAVTAAAKADINKAVPYPGIDAVLNKGVDNTMTALKKMATDQTSVLAILMAVLDKDMPAAGQDLKALLQSVVGGDLAKLVAAA